MDKPRLCVATNEERLFVRVMRKNLTEKLQESIINTHTHTHPRAQQSFI